MNIPGRKRGETHDTRKLSQEEPSPRCGVSDRPRGAYVFADQSGIGRRGLLPAQPTGAPTGPPDDTHQRPAYSIKRCRGRSVQTGTCGEENFPSRTEKIGIREPDGWEVALKLAMDHLSSCFGQWEGAKETILRPHVFHRCPEFLEIRGVYSATHADVVSGVGASFLVSPSITIVDRSITLKASGAMKISVSVREGVKEMVHKPHVFLRRPEFLMIWGVYAATYATANMIMTTCERRQVDDTLPKLIGTTIVNITTVVAKDLEFARMFSTVKPKPAPIPTYLLFTARDGMTVAASFNMPGPVSKYLQERLGMSQKTAEVIAQLACPSGIQLLSTPLNLLGLDLYNNPNSSIIARGQFIASEYTSAMLMRVCRTGPAFGIGGVGNTTFRKYFTSLFTSQ